MIERLHRPCRHALRIRKHATCYISKSISSILLIDHEVEGGGPLPPCLTSFFSFPRLFLFASESSGLIVGADSGKACVCVRFRRMHCTASFPNIEHTSLVCHGSVVGCRLQVCGDGEKNSSKIPLREKQRSFFEAPKEPDGGCYCCTAYANETGHTRLLNKPSEMVAKWCRSCITQIPRRRVHVKARACMSRIWLCSNARVCLTRLCFSDCSFVVPVVASTAMLHVARRASSRLRGCGLAEGAKHRLRGVACALSARSWVSESA